jgi:hypothetical protein
MGFARTGRIPLVTDRRGLVRDEDDPVSENPSERDPKAVYSEDEEREGALQ